MNDETEKINVYDDNWFPKISDLVAGMNDTEKRALEFIVAKEPADTWEHVAEKIGISSRQLFNVRQSPKVQEAVYVISREMLRGDVPDVLKTLTRKAKAGEPWAVRLFLEVAREISPPTRDQDEAFYFPIPAEDARAMLKVGGDARG